MGIAISALENNKVVFFFLFAWNSEYLVYLKCLRIILGFE